MNILKKGECSKFYNQVFFQSGRSKHFRSKFVQVLKIGEVFARSEYRPLNHFCMLVLHLSQNTDTLLSRQIGLLLPIIAKYDTKTIWKQKNKGCKKYKTRYLLVAGALGWKRIVFLGGGGMLGKYYLMQRKVFLVSQSCVVKFF